jgi:sec-independent protein translocase protein TatC
MDNQTLPSLDGEKPFLTHISELRDRLRSSIIMLALAFVVGLVLYNDIISFIVKPFNEQLYITQIEQGFTTKIKISFYLGIIFSFPFHVHNIMMFILPALTLREKRILVYFLFGSFLLVMFGGYMAYFKILPLSIRFLKSSSFVPGDVSMWLNFKESTLFVFQLVLAFLTLFQLPLVMLVLLMMDVISRAWLLRSARYFIILIFLVSAILTPPDVVSQLGLAVPLILLFYVTILLAKIFNFGEVKD